MSFKTQQEIWEALISQKKIIYKTWKSKFLQLDAGFLCDETGSRYDMEFNRPSDWSLYEEKMKTVTLYRYTYGNGGDIFQTGWSSERFDLVAKLLKTEEKQIQIEDV